MATEGEKHPEKVGVLTRLCQSRLCLPVVFLAVAAGVAVAVPVILLSSSVRDRFAPDMKWWQKTIVYQIYPRSFQDSDNDGLGDLKGITSRLDHFTYLNVKTIWLSPFYPSPQRDFGYDVSDFTDVDPRFGNLTDFDDMLKAAHKKGLKVIIDFVAGHTSSDHPWFQLSVNRTSPYEDYYIWANGTTLNNGTVVEPSNWVGSFGGPAWTYNSTRKQYYYHRYLPEQPTLNYRNPLVVEEMKNVMKFWLDRGVDGLRVDAVSHMMVYEDYHQDQAPSNRPGKQPSQAEYYIQNLTRNRPEVGDIIKGWRELLDSYQDDDDDTDDYKFMVVEVAGASKNRIPYFGYGADMPFNFDLLKALSKEANHKPCDAICIRDVIQNGTDQLPEGKWANYVLSSHDEHRALSRMGVLYKDALNVLLLTLRGTPTTYYGEEIGMEDITVSYADTQDPKGKLAGRNGYQSVSRDPERSPMQWDNNTNAGFTNSSSPWLPVHPDYKLINVELEKNSSDVTTLKVYRDLAVLRDQPSFQYGVLTFGDVTPSLLSYLRSAQDHPDFLVVINFGNSTATQDFSGSPVKRGQGRVKVVTSLAANEGRFVKDTSVSLKQLTLNPGDGLVIELADTTD